MVGHHLESTSVSTLIPRMPDLVRQIGGRTPITMDSVVSHHKPLNQVDLHVMPPPRNLGEAFLAINEVITRQVELPLRLELPMSSTTSPPEQNWQTSTNQRVHENLCSDDELEATQISTVVDRAHRILDRHFLGRMDVACPNCLVLHWIDEKLANSTLSCPRFGTCCLQGKIHLPLLRNPPPQLQVLYDGNNDQSKSFRKYAREYNAANAFTSLGAKMDSRLLTGRGLTSFTIHGELRHRTGALLPQPGHEGVYAQLYIYDLDSALNVRNRRNPHFRRDVLQTVQDTLLQYNAFIDKFCQAYELLNQSEQAGEHLTAYLHYSAATDRRRYNLPTSDEIAVILPGDGTEVNEMRDIVLHLRGNNELMRISECHPAYLPLHYVILFPHGELGWEPPLKQWDVLRGQPANERLTQLQFYSYRLFEWSTEYSTILRAGKLFQEFLVDAWAATEQNRLNYNRLNQGRLRAELYKGLTDIGADGLGPDQVGQRIILPSSFVGSPRHMFEIFQDSMAITRYNHHPDIFFTMTANPNWPEITLALLPYQNSVDRPDLVARVFELKRKYLMKEIEKKNVFGRKVAHVYTIEFQKRGLPHMHALFFLEGADKIQTCAQVDMVVSAEFPSPEDDPILFETVKSVMVHGPCGARNSNAPCLDSNGRCTKRYPRAFVDGTTMDQDGYPIYRRRNNGKVYTVKGQDMDNRDVVPYNAYIGAPEAARRILGHNLHEEFPSIVRLALHLPGMHHVVFNETESMNSIISRAGGKMSTLTGYFAYCASNEAARAFTYQEFPQHFVWQKTQQIWTPRQRGYAIGRMYFAAPNSGERFYLRLLLTIVKGPRSFECLRTINNVLHHSFKSACVAMGLLEDDEEWIQCLQEASIMNTGYQLRRLFCVILTQCCPLQLHVLWNQFSVHICDDLAHKIRTLFAITNPTEAQIEDYGLYFLNQLLQESGKSLIDFPPMPQPIRNWSMIVGNRLIWEHRQLHIDAQQMNVQINVDRLNDKQREAYVAITSSVFQNKGTTFFLGGGAGTGKTFLYNTIATKCRSIGHTAELFRETKLIIWDEVPMQHRYCVETVDRTLKDICDNINPFGGITVVLGGDFRQVLPVIPKGVREQIVAASLRRSIGSNPQEIVKLPSTIHICRNLNELLSTVYPQLDVSGTVNSTFLTERTILCARNEHVTAINIATLNMFPSETTTYLAADKMSEDDEVDRNITNRYPNEYLNSLNPPGLPPFKIELKVGCPIMLLRNIAPNDGLCNGTRLMVVRCASRIIEAQILTGDKRSNLVFIPRISLAPSSSEFPFRMTRH
ncbi:uncharacterized protein LOC130755327 [Actinidia eriantha]|uniref:uncharacterized protein LOC130755327 n=1 Tax=Actinidia eriantha TaxID=165200 RepID=UPI002588EDE3|nr:uncharacterized protein LOC130755327 [Actinidia eriantha]